MTGTKLYRFSFRLEVRNASGAGFACSGVRDPEGDPLVFFGEKKVVEAYENDDITNTTTYDTTVTHDGDVCEEITTDSDYDPEKDYGAATPEDNETTYSGAVVTAGDIISYAKGRASLALSSADWSNFGSYAGGTWAAAHALGTSSLVGEGPGYLYSGGLEASAGAMELRMFLRPPYIPVKVIFEYQGGEFSFDLTSSTPITWTPSWPSAAGVPNPIRMRAYPLPYLP